MKILDINTSLQQPNRILKDDSNLVSTVLDAASNVAFVQSDDILVSIGNPLIDPSSASVGDKVFTPPRRSSSQLWQIRNTPETYK